MGVLLLQEAEPDPLFQLFPPLVQVPLPPVKFTAGSLRRMSHVNPLPMVISLRTSVSTP